MNYNPFQQAEEFIEAAWRVFPLWGVNADGSCMCDNPKCEAARKHPRHSRWPSTPEWDEDQLEVMREYTLPDAGYGVLCKGLLVIDVDARNGGLSSWTKLLEDVPEVAGAGMVVETGSGGGSKHLYFSAPSDAALQVHLAEYPGLDFKSGVGHFVVGPGSMHKSGNFYRTVDGDPYSIEPAPDALLDKLKKPERHRAEYNGTYMDVSLRDIEDMLAHVSPDCDHDTWIRCGMAAHHATGGAAFPVWDNWSGKSGKYPGDEEMQYRWHSFGKSANPVTLGTLVHYAEEGGWRQSVTFDMSDDEHAPLMQDDDTLDFSDVNVHRPPGFVGKVAQWIASQPRRKRDIISVGAAIVAMGNIVGLKYIDKRDKVTGNVFAFCVAGSGTGKEAVQSAFSEIMREAGLQSAEHGGVKSSKEIYNNLIEHQPAFYNIDEVSDVLEAVNKAKSRGSSGHHDTTLATWMSAYSKANGFMLLNGDAKRDVRRDLLGRLGRAEDDGNTKEAERLERAIRNIDSGLEKPFLSLIGYGTPDKFHALMTFRAATEGFFGRALIFEEKNPVPPMKPNYKPTPMPDDMKRTIIALYQMGSYDPSATRIEHAGARKEVPTSPDADILLTKISEYMDERAAHEAESTGLEALYLRGYEAVSKVSFILGAVEGVRTIEHVRYAAALVMADLALKANLVTAVDRAKDSPAMALRSRIVAVCGDEGATIGVIRNRIRSYKPEDVERMCEAMVADGDLVKEQVEHPKKKTLAVKYKVSG